MMSTSDSDVTSYTPLVESVTSAQQHRSDDDFDYQSDGEQDTTSVHQFDQALGLIMSQTEWPIKSLVIPKLRVMVAMKFSLTLIGYNPIYPPFRHAIFLDINRIQPKLSPIQTAGSSKRIKQIREDKTLIRCKEWF